MIELQTLAKDIENKLNKPGQFNFNINIDTAQFKSAIRQGNQEIYYVNGLMRSLGSEVSNLISSNKDEPGLLYATQSCNLQFLVKLEDIEENIYTEDGELIETGYKTKLEDLRVLLDDLFSKNSTEVITYNNKSFTVSTIYSLVSSGTREMVDGVGDAFTYSVDIFYMYVENGINTRDFIFELDGMVIPYQSVTTYRTPTMDGNVYANTKDGSTKNIASQSTLSISFELPATTDNVTQKMIDYLLDGELNQAHFLKVRINGRDKRYLVAYGENKLIGETVKNLGQNLSLVECPTNYDLISFPENYYIYTMQGDLIIEQDLNFGDKDVFIFNNSLEISDEFMPKNKNTKITGNPKFVSLEDLRDLSEDSDDWFTHNSFIIQPVSDSKR